MRCAHILGTRPCPAPSHSRGGRSSRRGSLIAFLALAFSPVFPAHAAAAADWPMWRHDAGHTACTPEPLPATLQLAWQRQLPPPRACWPWTQYKLQFDVSYEPVMAGNLLFVPSMVRDRITAFDLDSGEERWRFYADAPIRFAPVAHDGRLLFSADDGCLYCLDAATGRLEWKFAGAPPSTTILGNGRLISSRPARGGPVAFNNTVYFAAGVWPFMGTFIHALNPATGERLWSNTGTGQIYNLQPHHSPAFSGVAPQGPLAATADVLLVPGGRSVPAAYDRHTGRFLYFRHSEGKGRGGYDVMARSPWFVNFGEIYELKTGEHLFTRPVTVLGEHFAWGILPREHHIAAWAMNSGIPLHFTRKDRRGHTVHLIRRYPVCVYRLNPGSLPVERVFLKAGNRLVATAGNTVAAIALPQFNPARETRAAARRLQEKLRRAEKKHLHAISAPDAAGRALAAKITWKTRLPGKPWSLLAARGRLVAVTQEGRILCFVPAPADSATRKTSAPTRLEPPHTPLSSPTPETRRLARLILAHSNLAGGYALAAGASARPLCEALLQAGSALRHVALLCQDPDRIRIIREHWDAAGLYGSRAAVLPGALENLKFAPYFASLVLVPEPQQAGLAAHPAAFAKTLFHLLHPYGGSAWLRLDGPGRAEFAQAVHRAGIQSGRLRRFGEWTQWLRPGPLPGAGTWTQQYGNPANTVCSPDRRVRPPFGLLWFGGPTLLDELPRHGHGPPEQVIGGRLFLEGIRRLSARDVYTGRVLWRIDLPDLDTFNIYYNKTFKPDVFDRSYNQVHIPGANAYGTNFVAAPDRLYIVTEAGCRVLDAASGKRLATLKLPPVAGQAHPRWGYIGVVGDLLVAGAVPVYTSKQKVAINYRFGRGDKALVVMDRKTGQVLWTRTAAWNFRRNTIVASGNTLYCIDGMTRQRLQFLARRGIQPQAPPKLLALDLRTGRVRRQTTQHVFGTWLGYSSQYDILLEAGSRSGDRPGDETDKGMAAFRGRTGKLLWTNQAVYLGPCILHHDWIITQVWYGTRSARPGRAYSLLTGKPILRKHPLTGKTIPWSWLRFYGCNTAIAGENLLTFRSASAAYLDLKTGQGTASIGGFKSGCTSNLIPADGVLNAPDYTRTCTCSYPNQTSLALIHSDDVETWTFDFFPAPDQPEPVQRLGLNLGAPGDHTATDGTLWLEYPSIGGPSPDVPVWSEPEENTRPFRKYSLYVHGALPWVGASGIEGIHRLIIRPFLQPAGKNSDPQRAEAWTRNPYEPGPVVPRDQAKGAFATPQPFTVTLVFAEFLPAAKPGERRFDVSIQGKTVLRNFDPLRAAGAADRTVLRRFPHILVRDDLILGLTPAADSLRPPLLCGVRILREPTSRR